MSKLKKLLAFVLFVAVMLVGSTMALPTLTVSVQQAAMGYGTITAPASNASVNMYPSADGQSLASVGVKFDTDLQPGAVVYVYVYDSNSQLVDNGNTTLSATLSSGVEATIPMSTTVTFANVDQFEVIVFGPKV